MTTQFVPKNRGADPISISNRLDALQADLARVGGITSARVVGDDVPREIHVVASVDRPPKQVVRDVQSLAAAAHGFTIDHRIVSVVQLEGELAAPRPSPDTVAPFATTTDEDGRPSLERVVFATKGSSGWVKVALKWANGEETEGAATVGETRVSRAHGAVSALQRALDPALTKRDASLYVDNILIQPLGPSDAVFVRASLHGTGEVVPLVGSALIYDDVATAAVRALLQAINRQFR